jgi:hypothetical protein
LNTEAGKSQGTLRSWGVLDTHQAVHGTCDLVDEDGSVPSVGTDADKGYMVAFSAAHPEQMPCSMEQVREVDVDQISEHPILAGITWSRQQCQRCHVGVNCRERRGDYRGAGCPACHVPYSNEGFHEGIDPTSSKDQPGKLMTHHLQATRKSKVVHGDVEYGSPNDAQGGKQPKLHTKACLFIKDNLHHQVQSRDVNPDGGLLCQDCHTTIDKYGDGNLPGTTLAQMEIECVDCRGTVGKFPWELALGHDEEFQQEIAQDARGLADDLTDEQYVAEVYDAEDGYLSTTRGNRFGKVIPHSASCLDVEVPVLKQIALDGTWTSPNAEVAMMSVGKHMESMECYACHADWAPTA